MVETLEEGLARLFSTAPGQRPPAQQDTRTPAPTTQQPAQASADAESGLQDLATEAQRHYERAVQAQRSGDWATYGEELRQLGQVLERMRTR
jgi:uncharacterized membrane protein (UPF0182 family)